MVIFNECHIVGEIRRIMYTETLRDIKSDTLLLTLKICISSTVIRSISSRQKQLLETKWQECHERKRQYRWRPNPSPPNFCKYRGIYLFKMKIVHEVHKVK